MERAQKACWLLSFLSISVNQCMFFPLNGLEVRWFTAQLHVIINEFGNYGVFSIGQNKSHFPILLCDDRHHAEVIDIDVGRAEKIVKRVNEDVSFMVFDAKLPVFLKHFVEFDVFLLDALQVSYNLSGIVNHSMPVAVGVAIVGSCTRDDHLPIKSADGFSVQINIAGNSFFFLRNT